MTAYVLIGLLLLLGVYLGTVTLIRRLDSVDPKKLKQGAQWTAGAAAAVVVLALILTGRSGVAFGLAAAAAPFFLPRKRDIPRETPNDAAPQPPRPPTGGMSREEACAILGIEPGASDAEVRAAHKRLIKACHPDHGGTDALAAKVNQAKDTLLG